jgi:hypothetical protein
MIYDSCSIPAFIGFESKTMRLENGGTEFPEFSMRLKITSRHAA